MNLYGHQIETRDFSLARDILIDASDPGTGKTIANLAAYDARRTAGLAGRLLVVCPKSITTLAWGRDTTAAFPHLSHSVASAQNRVAAFVAKTDIVVINHDGLPWLKNNMPLLAGFTDLIIDESTAFKNRSAGRSAAARLVCHNHPWQHKALLSGTPMPNGVTDIWHQVFLLDRGVRLGKNFHSFQSAVCDAKQVGPKANHLKWVDKDGINDVVVALLEDIMIRHRLEECIDIPPNHTIELPVTLNARHRTMYNVLRDDAVLRLEQGEVTAFHAGSLRQKLLQLLSGAVYGADGSYLLADTDRYNLVVDLIEQRKASLVAFLWTHQRDEIARIATERGLTFAIIDGNTPSPDRVQIVDAFQRGELKFILGHPRTMSHGVTLTYGTSTIWPSPPDNAEWFIQMNRRVYRNGQTAQTDTVLVSAEDTLEVAVYERLQGKVSRQDDLLSLIELLDSSPNTAQNPPTTEGTRT